jgi:hypothetical protein
LEFVMSDAAKASEKRNQGRATRESDVCLHGFASLECGFGFSGIATNG